MTERAHFEARQPPVDTSWLSGVPIVTDWYVPREMVMLSHLGAMMHPFMADQIAATSIADRFARIRATIGRRVDELAARALQRIDLACDVDSLDV